MDDLDDRLRSAILQLLDARRPGATICPSDAARAVGTESGWRELMDPARAAAQSLADHGDVEITQRGAVVDLATSKGPVRIRKAR